MIKKQKILFFILFLLSLLVSFSCSHNADEQNDNNNPKFVSQIKKIKADIETLGINATTVKSNDVSIASVNLVNNIITITSVSEGKTTIIAAEDDKTATISVTISNSGDIDLSISKYEVKFISQELKIYDADFLLGILPTSITSSDESIATVILDNNEIVITSKSKGNVIITATDGKHSATIDITVSENGKIIENINKYEEKIVTLFFDLDSRGRYKHNNSYGTYSITGEAGEYISETPLVIASDGYKFEGWLPEVPEVFPEENTTYVAVFSEASFTITYNLNGGIVDGENPTSFTLGTNYITPIQPTKEGYTFAGWSYTNEGASSSMVEKVYVNNIKNIVDGNLNLYALWLPNIYYIIFTSHSSSGGCYAKIKYNTKELRFFKYMYTSTAIDANKYSNVDAVYTPLDDTKFDGWQITYVNSEDDNWNIIDEANRIKLLDNNANLMPNIPNITDEDGNWISTCSYEVGRITK